jgi:hypothetical protein
VSVREAIRKRVTPTRPFDEVWSSTKIKGLLKQLEIDHYDLDFESRAVILYNLDDLYRVMFHTGKKELSDRCRMSMSKFKKKVCLEVGAWQFEAPEQ